MRFRSAIMTAAIFAAVVSQAPIVRAQIVGPQPTATPPLKTVQVLVPAGTRVPVSPTDKISSATAQVGDIIAVSATENVNDLTCISPCRLKRMSSSPSPSP